MKSIKSKKYSARFNELYDWVDDDTVEKIDAYEENNFDTIDYDALERGEVPVIEIDDAGVEGILTDNLQEPQMQEPIIEELVKEPEEEIAIEGEDVPDFSNVQEAMNWAIENNRVVKIFYTTKGGRRGRGGKKYLLREKMLTRGHGGGVSIYRIIEPHYMYQAGNGNLILVTYDRSVRYIRAFIVDNITDYNFTQNRRTKKPQHFKPRIRVMPKSNKGINIMKNINKNLTEVAAEIKAKGMVKSAAVVRDAVKIMDDLKIAQYVGVQGYWIRNRRCWDNCYRQKRTTKPKTPAQEVWMECWDEYRESINNNNSGWEKYAKGDEIIKFSSKEEKKQKKLFASKVDNKVKDGITTPEAIYATIEEESKRYNDNVLDSSSKLMVLAETLKDSHMADLGDKLAKVAIDMLVEAGLWQGIKNVGKGIADMWGGGKKKADPSQMKQKIFDFSEKARQLAEKIRQNIRYITKTPMVSSNSKIIIEAKKKEAQMPSGMTMQDINKLKRGREQDRTALDALDYQAGQEQAAAESNQGAEELRNIPNIDRSTPASQEQVNIISQVNSIAYQADSLAAWIRANVSIDDPVEKSIADKAIVNLTQAANSLRNFMTSGNLNNEGVAQKLEELAQGAISATTLVGAPPSVPTAAPEAAPTAPTAAPSGTVSTGSPGVGSPFQEGQADTGIKLTFDKAKDTSTLIANPQMYNYIKNLIRSIEANMATNKATL